MPGRTLDDSNLLLLSKTGCAGPDACSSPLRIATYKPKTRTPPNASTHVAVESIMSNPWCRVVLFLKLAGGPCHWIVAAVPVPQERNDWNASRVDTARKAWTRPR